MFNCLTASVFVIGCLYCYSAYQGYYFMLINISSVGSCPPLPTSPLYDSIPVNKTSANQICKNYNKWHYKYSLYRYYDRSYPIRKGIQPIVFIPGSRGLYQNIQFFGTMLLELQHKLNNSYFDLYTLDFGLECSFYSGNSLMEEADFTCDAFNNILSFYKKDTKILIIGHSMGGVVARLALYKSQCKPDKVLSLITISSPHLSPSVSWDSYLVDSYRTLKRNGNYSFNIFGIVGGWRDLIIYPTDLMVNSFVSPEFGFTLSTSHIDGLLMSLDHHEVVYCNKWIKLFTQTLWDVYSNQPLITTNATRKSFLTPQERTVEFYNHLVHTFIPKNQVEYDLLRGYRDFEKVNITFSYYKTLFTVHYCPRLPAASVFILLLCVLTFFVKPDSNIFDIINPVNHWHLLKDTGISIFYILIYSIQVLFKLNLELPNPAQFVLLYSGAYVASILFGIAAISFLSPFYIIIRIIKTVLPKDQGEFPDISLMILIFSILAYQFNTVFFPESLIHEINIKHIISYIIPFMCLIQFIFQVVIIIHLLYQVTQYHSIFFIVALAKIGIMAQQLGYYYDVRRFFGAPPGTYHSSDMYKYIQTFVLDFCLTTFYYLNWKYKFLLTFTQQKIETSSNNDKVETSKRFILIRKYYIIISEITLCLLLFTLMNFNCYALHIVSVWMMLISVYFMWQHIPVSIGIPKELNDFLYTLSSIRRKIKQFINKNT